MSENLTGRRLRQGEGPLLVALIPDELGEQCWHLQLHPHINMPHVRVEVTSVDTDDLFLVGLGSLI